MFVFHDSLLIGFKPIDDLHREFQDILDALTRKRKTLNWPHS